MNSTSQRSTPTWWPAPPSFHPAEPYDGTYDQRCAVELIDGRVLQGSLVDFSPGAESIGLQIRPQQPPSRIDSAKVRSITVSQPIQYVLDTQGDLPSGKTELASGERKAFVVSFSDGTQKKGQTLGIVRNADGLYLFIVQGESTRAAPCLIPPANIESYELRTIVGNALIEAQVINGDTLSAAINSQSLRRRDRARQSLAERAITSPVVLARAIRNQTYTPNVRLGKLLVESDLITTAQLDTALKIQAEQRNRLIGEILIETGAISMRTIQFVLADKLGIPYVDARTFPLDPGALDAIDTAFAIRHQVLPLAVHEKSLVVAVEDPLAIDFAPELRLKAGTNIIPVMANPQDLKVRIAAEYSSHEGRALDPSLGASGSKTSTDGRRDPRHADFTASNAADLASQLGRERQAPERRPVIEPETDVRVSDNTLVKLVNKIIIEANALGASDIHIESNQGDIPARIRFRRDGDLEDYLDLPHGYCSSLVSRIKVMAGLDISEHRHPQDGKIDFGRFGPLPIELRVAVVPTSNNLEDVVLRILGGAEPVPLDRIGFSPADLERIKAMISRSYGLILVCGPTGSGKTTTLHSILRHINRPDIKIWTAEDPIEITQPGLRQVQMQPKIGLTFAAAMRAFLRADPDVIMVGEMRDEETSRIGIEASLTGHLVFSTLHTNSAAESIVRLLDLGMEPFNFADALIGILSQRLARRLCKTCRQSHVASEQELLDLATEYCGRSGLEPAAVLADWRKTFGENGNILLRQPVGCDFCRDGYKGRVAIYELLTGSPEIKHLVRSGGTVPQLLAEAQRGGMLTLRQNAIEQVLRGVLDLKSARAVSS